MLLANYPSVRGTPAYTEKQAHGASDASLFHAQHYRGPVNLKTLRILFAEEVITGRTYVFAEHLSKDREWVRIERIPVLLEALKTSPAQEQQEPPPQEGGSWCRRNGWKFCLLIPHAWPFLCCWFAYKKRKKKNKDARSKVLALQDVPTGAIAGTVQQTHALGGSVTQ